MPNLTHFFAHQHDFYLILVAAVICVVASFSTLALLRLSQGSAEEERRRWVLLACVVAGYGIWATHFVAMVGYQTDIAPSYSPTLTALSLCVAVIGNVIGYCIAAKSPAMRHQLAAATVVGCGIAGMHYLGMVGTQFSGELMWNWPLLALSIPLGILPNIWALRFAFHSTGLRSTLRAALLMVLGTVALHFTGMAAFTLQSDGHSGSSDAMISANAMSMAVGAIAVLITSIATVAAGISARARSKQYRSEREFRILVESISDCALYMIGPDGFVSSWNVGAERLTGYTAEEAIGLPFAQFYPKDLLDQNGPAADMAEAQAAASVNFQAQRLRKDGSSFWADISMEALYDRNGVLQGYAKITRDITLYRSQQEALTVTSAKLDVALSNMRQGLCLFDADGRLILMNNRLTELCGVTPVDCPVGTPFEDVFRVALERRSDGPVTDREFAEAFARHRQCICQAGGGTLLVPFTDNCTISVAHSPVDGGGWVTTFEDITERHQAEQKIQYMALHDTLTGLPNRFNFIRQLDTEIQHAESAREYIAVVGIDLDGFKEINDFQGHAAGDQLLKSIGDRLSSVTMSGERVARFGGDEFAAFKRFQFRKDCDDFLERLASCFKDTMPLEEGSLVPAASLGVAIYPMDGQNREQMINNADLAMYRAKGEHGTQLCYYEQGMDEAARARRLLANDLRHALDRDEFSLAFQVQRHVTSDDITGYEALLRWNHPAHGWISPDHFIPLAEENGTILAIGEWVLRNACRAAKTWTMPWTVAVNLSAVQLMQTNFVHIVEDVLKDTGLPAERLELEITETSIISDKAKALPALRYLKALGVTIAIDDFGTGYSSLDTLNSFPFDKIKIDKSFLLDSDTNEQSRAIIRAVLALGKSLEIPVLAEGLETISQLALLRSEGCDYAQGYLWGRPELQRIVLEEIS
jgi:diguanylate cyclase (GGDEF)-like protein/PAS domain S-box-containing protein